MGIPNGIRKLFAGIFILLYFVSYTSSVKYTHTHKFSDGYVTHSHPFKSAAHSHSATELAFIPSGTFVATATAMASIFITWILVMDIQESGNPSVKCTIKNGENLRAPPALV